MDSIEIDHLPNITQTFPTRKGPQPDNVIYKEKINHYLHVFCSKAPQTSTTILYQVLNELFGKIWEDLFIAKNSQGELKEIHVTWWDAPGIHRTVDAEFYLENWKENYSNLAENWHETKNDPDSIHKISERIRTGIAGLLYVAEYEDTIFATIKYHQIKYKRTHKWSIPWNLLPKHPDRNDWSVKEIVQYASSLPYDEGIKFLGELSGAYILSCPAKFIKSSSLFQEVSQRNITFSTEEKYVMVLLKYICEYGSQEFAMSASDFPLQCVKMPGEEWKFIVKIPDTI